MSTGSTKVKIGTGALMEFVKGPVDNTVPILRLVNNAFIRNDKTLSNEAYRPRKRPENPPTGIENNVSTAPLSCYPTKQEQEKYAASMNRKSLYRTLPQFPHDYGYPCIQDKPCHIGITGDMTKLIVHEEALEHIAVNSTPVIITKEFK